MKGKEGRRGSHKPATPALEKRTEAGARSGVPRGAASRGAAPWTARYAKKHAEEARARNAEPALPGSARASLREPEHADEIKARVAELHHAIARIRELTKNTPQAFWEIAELLRGVEQARLYDAKGYTSFEAFLEREVTLDKSLAQRLTRLPGVFVAGAARVHGLAALLAALVALDEAEPSSSVARAPRLPLKPPTRR